MTSSCQARLHRQWVFCPRYYLIKINNKINTSKIFNRNSGSVFRKAVACVDSKRKSSETGKNLLLLINAVDNSALTLTVEKGVGVGV